MEERKGAKRIVIDTNKGICSIGKETKIQLSKWELDALDILLKTINENHNVAGQTPASPPPPRGILWKPEDRNLI